MPATLTEPTVSTEVETVGAIGPPFVVGLRWPHLLVGLSIFDQCIVSGLNFLTTVVGRWCGLSELGYYSLAFTVVVVLMALQEPLLVAPLTLLRIGLFLRAMHNKGLARGACCAINMETKRVTV